MSREPAFLAESRALQEALRRHPTLAELHGSAEWPALAPRLERLLDTVHRHAPAAPPPPPPYPDRVRAVHWNIEHGNWYEEVETALLTHPDLRDADLILCNEIDLGMARAGNRDVTADLSATLGRHGVWAPMFLETTVGRDDDASTARGRENLESLFGIALLSRWPVGETRVVELPSPREVQFDTERMYGRHVALVATIQRPGAPFVAVSAHLEVHRTREHRAAQVRTIVSALERETRPVIFAGDFNTHTFDRGRWWDPISGAAVLTLAPGPALANRLLHPDRGPTRETLFDALHGAGFAWSPWVDDSPTLQLRFDRLEEVDRVFGPLAPMARRTLAWAERRGLLRLDWFTGRGWMNAASADGAHGRTVHGLDGPGRASDHAPIVAEFW